MRRNLSGRLERLEQAALNERVNAVWKFTEHLMAAGNQDVIDAVRRVKAAPTHDDAMARLDELLGLLDDYRKENIG